MVLAIDTTAAHVGDKRPRDAGKADDRAEDPLHRAWIQRSSSSFGESESVWATLPLVATELVFSFALVDLSVQIDPIQAQHQRAIARHVADAFSLRQWSSVCRGWRDTIEQLIAQHQEGTVRMDFVLKRSEDLAQKLETAMNGKRAMVHDLRVAIYRHINAPLHPQLPSIHWTALLTRCVNLQRLDLSDMNCLKREEMCDVLDAASQCCPKLRALVFPLPYGWTRPACFGNSMTRLPHRGVDKQLLAALAVALERWHHSGGSSGSSLEQLVLPCAGSHADEFVALVTKFVPRIQLLDAWKLAYFNDGWDDVRCDEHWHLQVATWQAFCQTCVHLREFNWAVVPFTDSFVAPFAVHKKWQLKELTFNFTKCASPVFQVVHQGQAHLRRSLGIENAIETTEVTSASLCSLVEALPRLEILRINLQSLGAWKLQTYDDEFLVALAKSCPNLKKLCIAGGTGYSSSLVLDKISDRGLAAIGRLAKLEELTLRPLDKITDQSITHIIGKGAGDVQLDAKLMLPPRLILHEVVRQIVEGVAKSVAQNTREFAVQIAIQDTKQRPQYHPNQLDQQSPNENNHSPSSARATMELRKCTDLLRGLQSVLCGQQSRIRFQAFVDEHSRKLTQINLFTAHWKPREHVGALFLKNEIVYRHEQEDAFQWVVIN